MTEATTIMLDDLLAEEAELHFTRFDYDDAWRLGTMLVDAARSRRLPIAIDITRGGQQLFHAALPGSTPDNDAWIQRKVRTVMRFGHSSLYVARTAADKGKSLAEAFFVDEQLFAGAGGSFPINVTGCGVVGAVTVSGLPQLDDHRLVVDTIRDFLASNN